MTCSDCVHGGVCENWYSWLDPEDNTKYNTCHLFKGKADWAEVIHCKHCAKSWETINGKRYCSRLIAAVGEDDYCSFAERKDGADNDR